MLHKLIQSKVNELPYKSGIFQLIDFSPPYWNLRDYQTAKWHGGDPNCAHSTARIMGNPNKGNVREVLDRDPRFCQYCGAIREDDQLGLEGEPDCGAWGVLDVTIPVVYRTGGRRVSKLIPVRRRRVNTAPQPCGTCFVCRTVEYMRELRRVLRQDGCVYMVIGDTFNGSGGAGGDYNKGGIREGQPKYKGARSPNLKPKDLVGIPWAVALALRSDGWFLRSEIIWHKTNPMPESATDRPGRAHETVFLFTKSRQYFWDMDAVRQVAKYDGRKKFAHDGSEKYQIATIPGENKLNTMAGGMHSRWPNLTPSGELGRNLRTVWTIPTQAYRGSHYATFPERLVEFLIKSGTSEKGACPNCGSPWTRVVKKSGGSIGQGWHDHSNDLVDGQSKARLDVKGSDRYNVTTEGWLPSCSCYGFEVPTIPEVPEEAERPEDCQRCDGTGRVGETPMFPDGVPCKRCGGSGTSSTGNEAWRRWEAEASGVMVERLELLKKIDENAQTVPCLILDPFSGSGTSVLVAQRLGRNAIGSDLSREYINKNAKKRINVKQPRLV